MVLWIIATFVAFFIKGLCGFANTLVFTSIMGFGANNVAISPVELMLGYPANFILTIKNRKKLDPKVYIPLACLQDVFPEHYCLKTWTLPTSKLCLV